MPSNSVPIRSGYDRRPLRTGSQSTTYRFRSKRVALPWKMAPRLAMSHTREIQAALTVAVREALEELSLFDLSRDRPGRPPNGSVRTSRRYNNQGLQRLGATDITANESDYGAQRQ